MFGGREMAPPSTPGLTTHHSAACAPSVTATRSKQMPGGCRQRGSDFRFGASEGPAWALCCSHFPAREARSRGTDHLPGSLQLGVSGLLSLKQLPLPTVGHPL